MSIVRDHLAAALHRDRDHTRDGTPLGSEPICNCYTLADAAITALRGVKNEREYGTVIPGGDDYPEVIMLDYRGMGYTPDPHDYVREVISFATPWQLSVDPDHQ